MQNLICEAIRTRNMLSFVYKGKVRTWNPMRSAMTATAI